MNRLFTIAQALDGILPRSAIARAATLYLGRRDGHRRRFSVDERGHWVNEQEDATIVSPGIHTAPLSLINQLVLDQWTYWYVPGRGDVIIDAGAGIGEDAVVFSHLVAPRGRIIAIEAHPATFNCLAETVRRSGLPNVEPLLCAVAEADGTLKISDAGNHLANSVVAGVGGVEVPARSLDSLADELGLDRVDLLKMNIEGAEKLAVRGMERLARITRHIVISCHDFIADAGGDESFRSKNEVWEALVGLGFAVTSREDHPSPWVRDYLFATNRVLAEHERG